MLSMTLLLPLALASGCAKISSDTYCDVTSEMIFSDPSTVDHLITNDRALLQSIVKHNELRKVTCNET